MVYNKYISPRKSHLLPRALPTVGSAPINGGLWAGSHESTTSWADAVTPVSECKMSVIDFLNRLYTPSHTHMPYKMSTSAFVFLQSTTSGNSKLLLALLVASRDRTPFKQNNQTKPKSNHNEI
jgi:hypothetical protein